MGITSVGTPARIRSWTLGMRVNLDLTATTNLLGLCGGCALAILDVKIHQSGGHRVKDGSAAFSMFFFEGYFTWLCTFALMVPTPSPIYVLKIGIGHKHNMVWCEINMQWLPFPCEEQFPTLGGSEAGRGDTHDGTCGWAHGGTMAGREAGV